MFSGKSLLPRDLERRRSTVTILARLGLGPIGASAVDQCREVLAKQNVGLVFSSTPDKPDRCNQSAHGVSRSLAPLLGLQNVVPIETANAA
jgi:hypothetical protein